MAESRVARDTVRIAMPLSDLAIGAGDVLRFEEDSGEALYRVDNVEQGGAQILDAVRVENEIYTASDAIEEAVGVRGFTAPVPVYPVFLDLPLLTGDETPHAPHIAVTGTPWPGSVAVYGSSEDAGYELNTLVGQSSIIVQTRNEMLRAKAGVTDNVAPLRVKVHGGALSSTTWDSLLNGQNFAAIGDGSSDNWELFQFTEAKLVEEDVYELSGRLRGQLGSDAIMPDVWPVDSQFILLDGKPEQIDLSTSSRGLSRHYRIGPSARRYDDASFTHITESFQGIGLRPYAPVHLRGAATGSDLAISWERRTRLEGDSWLGIDVLLNEESESYVLRIMDGQSVVREVTTSTLAYTYTAAQKALDGVSAPYGVEVAQVSQRFGAGPFRRIEIPA